MLTVALNLIPLESAPVSIWEELVTRNDAPPTMRAPWLRALEEVAPGAEPFLLLDQDARGDVCGGLPLLVRERGGFRSVYSLPCGVYGGPLFQSTAPRSNGTEAIASRLAGMVNGPKVLTFSMTCATAAITAEPALLRGPWRSFEEWTHVVDLSEGFEPVWKRDFEHCARRSIQRALEAGIEVISGRDSGLLDSVYALYHREATRRHWNIIYPISYFRKLIAGFPAARIWAARLDGEVVSGKILISDGRWVLSRLGVLDPKSRHACPHHLLWHRVLEDAAGRGASRVDMGPSRGIESIVRFKTSLGGRPWLLRVCQRRSALGRAMRMIRRAGSRSRLL